jgi:hypothetical protein
MMRRAVIVLLVLMLLLPAAVLTAEEALWTGFRNIVQGYRNVTALVESALALINTYNPKPGTAIHITSGLASRDFEELALKLAASGGAYAYLLEVWTKRGDVWSKAMEYSYDNASSGQIVFSPWAFDDAHLSGSLHRVEFQHTASVREMTVHSQHAVSVNNVTTSIGVATEQSGYVDLYFTAHLDQSFGGDGGTQDAYLFGARIGQASPHLCTAKQGLRDQGDAYDFTLFGAANPANNGHFDENGFMEDGQSADGIYPAAASVDASKLPTSAEVSAVSVSFQSTADPDFL